MGYTYHIPVKDGRPVVKPDINKKEKFTWLRRGNIVILGTNKKHEELNKYEVKTPVKS